MPITLQFGLWSPDLKDVPIQVPDNQGPLPIPCADVLNVVYANGAYQSIQGPASALIDGNTVSPINSQALNAFSFYDNVAQQGTVFVGTATGVQQLNPDGSWTAISVTTSQFASLIGQSISISPGDLGNSNAIRKLIARFTTGKLTPVVTGDSFVAGLSVTGGPFNIIVGIGFNSGANGNPLFGKLIHQDLTFGTLSALYDFNSEAVLLVNSSANPGQAAFNTITAAGKTFSSASASYTYGTGQASWSWPSQFGFSPGTTYSVIFA